MNKKLMGGVFVLAGVALLPTQVEATPILLQRCTVDSLSIQQAEARIKWARKCGLTKNVGSPSFDFDTGIPAANGGTLMDYVETDPDRNPQGEGSFSGTNYTFEVNSTFINTLYQSGGTTQSTDGFGYKQWTRPDARKRARPLYPTFGTTSEITDSTNHQLVPSSNDADCTLYAVSGGAATASSTYYVNGYCEASCYTPEQEVLFSDGYAPILDAVKARRDDLMTLTGDSTLDGLKLKKSQTFSYTAETRDAQHTVFVIDTKSGGRLRVTDEHPVINGEGRMVQAKTLKVGDELVQRDGTPDPIVGVEKTTYFGKVYNLAPVSTDLVSNVLVAQGFLVGSSRFQNDDVGYMNRVILFNSVPAQTIP